MEFNPALCPAFPRPPSGRPRRIKPLCKKCQPLQTIFTPVFPAASKQKQLEGVSNCAFSGSFVGVSFFLRSSGPVGEVFQGLGAAGLRPPAADPRAGRQEAVEAPRGHGPRGVRGQRRREPNESRPKRVGHAVGGDIGLQKPEKLWLKPKRRWVFAEKNGDVIPGFLNGAGLRPSVSSATVAGGIHGTKHITGRYLEKASIAASPPKGHPWLRVKRPKQRQIHSLRILWRAP